MKQSYLIFRDRIGTKRRIVLAGDRDREEPEPSPKRSREVLSSAVVAKDDDAEPKEERPTPQSKPVPLAKDDEVQKRVSKF